MEWQNKERPTSNSSESDKYGFCRMCCVCKTDIDRKNLMYITKPAHDPMATFQFPVDKEKDSTLDQSIVEMYFCNSTFMKGLPLKPDSYMHYETQKWQDFHSNQYKILIDEKQLNIIQQPLPEQATDQQCIDSCACKGDEDHSRKMKSEEIVKMKEKELKDIEEGNAKSGTEKEYARTPNGEEMFDMSMLKLDKNAGLEVGELAKTVVGAAVQKAVHEGGGLSIWSILKLIMLIISLKLMQVTFKSQQQMAVMAAQAPLMMMNPLSMFGFNPMNQSAALENAGQPAKFAQMDNSGFNGGNMNMNMNNGMSNKNVGQGSVDGINLMKKGQNPYLSGMYGNGFNLSNLNQGLKSQTDMSSNKSYYDSMKNQLGFSQKQPDLKNNVQLSKKDLLSNIDVFYDNFRKGFDVASKEKNFSNIYNMINSINNMNNSIMQGGKFIDYIINPNSSLNNVNNQNLISDNMRKDDNQTSFKDVPIDKNILSNHTNGNNEQTQDESIHIVQDLLKHNQQTYLNNINKFKQKDTLKDKNLSNNKNENKLKKVEAESSNILNNVGNTLNNLSNEFDKHLNDKNDINNQLLENMKHYVSNVKEYALPTKEQKSQTVGDLIGSLNFFNNN